MKKVLTYDKAGISKEKCIIKKQQAVVWREYSDSWSEEDFKEDKEFIKQELKEWKPHIVYVNAQSVLTPNFGDYEVEIRYIEPEFKKLMGA